MAGRGRKWLLVIAMTLAAGPAWAQAPQERAVEVTPFAGYRFSPGGAGSETRFAFALGGGVKAPLCKHLGLRFDGRWVINRISGNTEFYCNSLE